MIGKLPSAQPISPVLYGRLHVLQRRLSVFGWVLTPRKRDEPCFAFLERRARVRTSSQLCKAKAARHSQRGIASWRLDEHGVVPITVVGPLAPLHSVVEQGEAVDDHLDHPVDASSSPQESADGSGVRRCSPVARPTRRLIRDRSDHEQVLHDQPSRRSVPRRLQHHRARNVPPLMGHTSVGRTKPKGPSGSVQQSAEDTR